MFHLHLRNELWKVFGKKRTYIGFGAFLLAQICMLLLFRFSSWKAGLERVLAANGYLASEYVSALTVSLMMLLPQVILLMPLYVALVGGDLVAKESEDGTLKMILSRPISRFQLLLSKWAAGLIFAATLVVVLGGLALLFARILFPWKGMFVFVPGMVFNVLEPAEALKLYLFSHMFMAVNASVILSLAFMFSCFDMKPAAATILALSFLFVNLVLEQIPFLDKYQEWFLPYHFRIWVLIYSVPTPWERVVQSVAVLLAFGASTFLIGTSAFAARDIKN
jgi:ABC-2 type transport system permease protein